jgi:hypothetical protein
LRWFAIFPLKISWIFRSAVCPPLSDFLPGLG